MSRFTGMPFQRLRWEFERRERKLAWLKRKLGKTVYHSRGLSMDTLAALYKQEAEQNEAWSNEADIVKSELKQIEEAMG
jgi:hypothetical protein